MAVQVHNEVDRKLADSLKKLAASHPIEKITIKDITDEAGVIRPTFYNHFQDKYELLEWIIGVDLLQPIFPLLHHGRRRHLAQQIFLENLCRIFIETDAAL